MPAVIVDVATLASIFHGWLLAEDSMAVPSNWG